VDCPWVRAGVQKRADIEDDCGISQHLDFT
jgi:hypothetical protein